MLTSVPERFSSGDSAPGWGLCPPYDFLWYRIFEDKLSVDFDVPIEAGFMRPTLIWGPASKCANSKEQIVATGVVLQTGTRCYKKQDNRGI